MEKKTLPNATAALILGVTSIISCCCSGIIGLPLGITAFILGNKAIKLDAKNPEKYEGVKNARLGKILGIVGIVFNIIFIIYVIWFLSLVGWDSLNDPELLIEKLNELENQ